MKISVVIPNYNHAKFLKQRIDSVFGQTYQDYEVIILDDFSTDNSREIIDVYKRHPKVSHVIYNAENSGSPFKQWAKGIKLSQGDYVWIAESDDWAQPEFLEVLMKNIEENENVGICFSDSYWIDEAGEMGKDLSIYKNSFNISGQSEIRRSLMKFNSIQNASAVLINRSMALQSVGKSIHYKATGDWLLYMQVLRNSNLVFVERKLNNFRWYHNNTSNKASDDGLWIIEGIRLLLDSRAYELHFTKSEFAEIKKYWMQKAIPFNFFKKKYFEILISCYFGIFKYKGIIQ